MDWKRAIEINREALTGIVAGLMALLAAQGDGARVAHPIYQLIARALWPAESAVRRLIVIMSRGLVVPVATVPVLRPMPKALVIVRKGIGGSFQLFDPRKRFSTDDVLPITGPRIRSIDDPSPREEFLAQFRTPAIEVTGAVEMARLSRRLAILKRALDTLPRQAKRMARWRAQRTLMQRPTFVSPLRPGPPPGHRKRPRDDIDAILTECHALAWHALSPDTS
jgi:hypothetical protein